MVVELLTELGGVATTATLLKVSSRSELDVAVGSGSVIRIGHGRYALPAVAGAVRAAHGLAGVLSHTSAALEWGWAVKSVPMRPDVTVPHKRKVDRGKARRVVLHRRDLIGDEVVDGRTSRD